MTLDVCLCHPHAAAAAGLVPARERGAAPAAEPFARHLLSLHCALETTTTSLHGRPPPRSSRCACCGGAAAAAAAADHVSDQGRPPLLSRRAAHALIELAVEAPPVSTLSELRRLSRASDLY